MTWTLISKINYVRSILLSTNTTNSLLFLRKSRLFVKSRYSRNRQWSKSIVYFGLWFNIMSVIWTIFYCYRYIFIFSHLYVLGLLFVFLVACRLYKPLKVMSVVKWLRSISVTV